MVRRKKHPRLPNGYGSIKFMGKNRRNPYAVYPPSVEDPNTGKYPTPKAICYTDDWYKGFAVLTAYHAGTYQQGYELSLNSFADSKEIDTTIHKILSDYGQVTRRDVVGKTFEMVYEEFLAWKFDNSKKLYSKSTKKLYQNGFKNCAALHKWNFSEIKTKDMQKILDDCPLKHASIECIKSLFIQMYTYAVTNDIVDKNYAESLKINTPDDDEHGVPFTEAELQNLWKNKDNEIVEQILIMCYSGFRISAYLTMETNLKEKYFKGGVKTSSGKGRIVPIHSAIVPLVEKRLARDGRFIDKIPAFRADMKDTLVSLGIEKRTPHDCRHTFSYLAQKYKMNEFDRKRMLGHSFGNDVSNEVYGHRDLEDLRLEIEKIKKPEICC